MLMNHIHLMIIENFQFLHIFCSLTELLFQTDNIDEEKQQVSNWGQSEIKGRYWATQETSGQNSAWVGMRREALQQKVHWETDFGSRIH